MALTANVISTGISATAAKQGGKPVPLKTGKSPRIAEPAAKSARYRQRRLNDRPLSFVKSARND